MDGKKVFSAVFAVVVVAWLETTMFWDHGEGIGGEVDR
jgi:hypothetical protein